MPRWRAFSKRKSSERVRQGRLGFVRKQSVAFVHSILNEIVDNVQENKQSAKDCRAVLDDIVRGSMILSDNKCNSDGEYDFIRSSAEEYERINQHQLEVEYDKDSTDTDEGYRIVNIQYIMQQALRLQTMHNQKCTGGMLQFSREERDGLSSVLFYKCNVCDKELPVCTENPQSRTLNKSFVFGTLATGSIFEHAKELLSVLDVPSMSKNQFYKIQSQLGTIWKNSLFESMEAAGREEHKIASEKGSVDDNGIAKITVIADGGWSKRSFGHTYNALSGVAAIIGKETGKLLHLGIKNKYCCICARAEHKTEPVKEHICFKNWTGSSASMEPAVIVEGFNCSMQFHKLKYEKFIGDGDSTVYSEVRKKVTYGLEVQKIECTNHALKCYGKNLRKIKDDTKNVSLEARKILSPKIQALQNAAQNAIYANAHGDVEKLKTDIRNSVAHVFGHHTNCQSYLCDKVGDTSADQTALLKSSGAHHHIYAALNWLLKKADLLIDKETSNMAELFMSILVRFNMGKRLNLVGRNSFEMRAHMAGLQFNDRHEWLLECWPKIVNDEASNANVQNKTLLKYVEDKKKEDVSKRKRNATFTSSKPLQPKNKIQKQEKKQHEYGPNIAETIMDEDALKLEVDHLIARLQIKPEDQEEIAAKSIGQFDNSFYMTQRKDRLTASNFGLVAKRRQNISCDKLVKQLLNNNKNFYSPATDFGKLNESVAISKFEEVTSKKVDACGLYVDIDSGVLAASPDGIIKSDDELVEVKCSYTVAVKDKNNLKAAVTQNKVSYLKMVNGDIQLNQKHNYYFQIQGQLAICNKEICNFIVYSGDHNPLFIQQIHKDLDFWNEMKLKLLKFYEHCLAPEIILGRRHSNLPCKDPPYILEAMEKATQKKSENKRRKTEKEHNKENVKKKK